MTVYLVPYLFRLLLVCAIAGILKVAVVNAINMNYAMSILEREERDKQLDMVDKIFGLVVILIIFTLP